MLQQVWMAQCDYCGKTEQAKRLGARKYPIPNNSRWNYEIPDGWEYWIEDLCLCKECAKIFANNATRTSVRR